jgi:hypothetical protein
MGIAESDLLTFLEVGDKALKRLEQLRQQGARQGGTDTDPDARLDAVEVILDARDDVARRLTPAAMRALRKSSPARGSVFDFPSNQ